MKICKYLMVLKNYFEKFRKGWHSTHECLLEQSEGIRIGKSPLSEAKNMA